jgi:uncharacterized SAM-dependent methyltransferase
VTASTTVTVDIHLTDADWQIALAAECADGLRSVPKRLSPVWFYDAHGSGLFDEITRLPEYYPTRAERSLLSAHADAIIQASDPDTLVELGSGTSEKTRLLLDAMVARTGPVGYVPFDVSSGTSTTTSVRSPPTAAAWSASSAAPSGTWAPRSGPGSSASCDRRPVRPTPC